MTLRPGIAASRPSVSLGAPRGPPRARLRWWDKGLHCCVWGGWPTRVARASSPRCAASSRKGPQAPTTVDASEPPAAVQWQTMTDTVGRTPLVRLQRLTGDTTNVILLKMEGNNPAGSVKDRPALSMITQAEAKGRIKPGDTLIEATSGNTGIALAMAAAIKGYRMILVMPSNMSEERKASMAAYGAELLEVPPGNMEYARDLAQEMQQAGKGIVLNQFGNDDNPLGHYESTAPELWEQTQGTITHFVSSMGTTGTIMGTSRFLKSKNPAVQIVGLQPAPGAKIAGIRRWPKEYLPTFFDPSRVDLTLDITQAEAEETMRALARVEGIFAGVSSGGAVAGALRLNQEVENAVICVIVCDRGDRYLSTGVFDMERLRAQPDRVDRATFWAAQQTLQGLPRPVVLFVGSDEEGTGASWCGDCRRAAPLIERLARTRGCTLLRCEVGSRPAWKDPDHPFRMAPLGLRAVPSLVEWRWHRRSDGQVQGRPGRSIGPELEACQTEAEMEALVHSFLEALTWA
mmetsp:Transcript_12729/g.46553  ORF Transcript_12729/g.46553 Transcript_12729/m.46553 type:complete len:517 (+) Transcript_12729:77-1627(+)